MSNDKPFLQLPLMGRDEQLQQDLLEMLKNQIDKPVVEAVEDESFAEEYEALRRLGHVR